jgi:hypothetical protein
MCFFGGGGSVDTSPRKTIVVDSQGGAHFVEEGVPGDYAGRGATTVAQYQQMAATDLSDKQIAAQKDIAAQQNALNEKQFAAQQAQYDQQQTQVREQADRQSQYDTGRAAALGEGSKQISDAFAQFSPEYFQGFTRDYMSKQQDNIDYQRRLAEKNLGFQLARQGISSSQAGINERGLIDETAGRATAEQTAAAQQAEANLRSNVANARTNLLGQVTASESIGSPIAPGTIGDVNSAIQTQRNAVSGITSNAGDVVSSLQAVPQVNTLSNIFSGVLGAGGNLFGGIQANQVLGQFGRGLAGTSPSGGGSTRLG